MRKLLFLVTTCVFFLSLFPVGKADAQTVLFCTLKGDRGVNLRIPNRSLPERIQDVIKVVHKGTSLTNQAGGVIRGDITVERGGLDDRRLARDSIVNVVGAEEVLRKEVASICGSEVLASCKLTRDVKVNLSTGMPAGNPTIVRIIHQNTTISSFPSSVSGFVTADRQDAATGNFSSTGPVSVKDASVSGASQIIAANAISLCSANPAAPVASLPAPTTGAGSGAPSGGTGSSGAGSGADTAVGSGQRLEQCTLVEDINLKDDIKVSQGVTAKPGTGEVITTASGTLETKEWAILCLINTVNIITDWIFIVLLVIAVALIAFAGILWMTAGGDAEKQKKAGAMILAAVIGIIIAVLARIIPAVVTGIVL